MHIFNQSRSNYLITWGNRGDTIVEVLIAIALVSLILVGAFVTSNRSLAATRDSQEHSEASQVLQSQIERARIIITSSASDAVDPLVTSQTLYCVDTTTATPGVMAFSSSYNTGGKALMPLATDTFAAYPSGCKSSAGNYDYNISVENHKTNFSLADDGTLVFHARWDRLGGGRNEVTYTYRGHATTVGTPAAPTGTPACVLSSDPNIIRNGNFAIAPPFGSYDAAEGSPPYTAYGFTSYIPYRGINLYPDDAGGNGNTGNQKGWLGGFSVDNNYDVKNGTPTGIWGTPLGVNTTTGLPVTSYYYSNPVESKVTKGYSALPPGGAAYSGPIWEETGLGVTSNTKYEFEMWVSNIKLPIPPLGTNPQIELKVTDNNGVAIADLGGSSGIDIPHTPTGSTTQPSTWIPKDLIFTTPASSTGVKLQIIDHAGRIKDDDFTMTGLGLYRCQ
jgi:Tfp pilus assembly protein PilV